MERQAAAGSAARERFSLQPGSNCWRVERAERIGVAIDGEVYFAAVRESMIKARRWIAISAWDIHSRTALLRGDAEPDAERGPEGLPVVLGELLIALLERNPQLQIYILLWDYSSIYALEREPPFFGDAPWNGHDRLHFVKDSAHPFGASQHQKLVLVDGRIAWCGGFDISTWRWDTSAHTLHDPRRTRPSGKPYPPFHDVQMLVDGAAARALVELFRDRWQWASSEPAPVLASTGDGVDADPWPDGLKPWLRDHDVGIARTLPAYHDRQPIRESEQLYLDSIAAADKLLYIENQYLTSRSIADALEASLRRPRGPEILIVLPRETGHWLEQHTMDVLRARLLSRLRAADRHGRLRVYYPDLPGLGADQCLMVHAKLLISDDRVLRVGTSNLSNRSMGLDSECDLCVVARGEEDAGRIRALRQQLLSSLMSVTPADLADAERAAAGQGRGVLAAVEQLQATQTRDPNPERLRLSVLEGRVSAEWRRQLPDERLVDPDGPLSADLIKQVAVGGPEHERHVRRRLVIGAVIMLLFLTLAALWRWTPLGDVLHPAILAEAARTLDESPWGLPVGLVVFVLASVVAIPVTLLILVSALVFGSATGGLLALVGSTLSALAGYAIGRFTGRAAVERMSGSLVARVSRRLAERGVLTIMTVRIVPVAPFAVLNLLAGASHLRLRDFTIGTILGMLPGVIAMSVFAEGLLSIAGRADLRAVALMAIGLAALAGLGWLGHRAMQQGD